MKPTFRFLKLPEGRLPVILALTALLICAAPLPVSAVITVTVASYEDSNGKLTVISGIAPEGNMCTATIKTAPGSRLELTLPDGSLIRLWGGGEIVLRRNYCASGRGFSWKLLAGKVWSKITQAIGGSQEITVETVNAATGNRGTIWTSEAGVKNGQPWTRVRVYEQAVTVSSLGSGVTVTVNEGMETTVTGDDPPAAPAPFDMNAPVD
jgi:ferric-dicitrate binding protein FerR (iron transport regulator)